MNQLLQYLADHLSEVPGGAWTVLVRSHFMLEYQGHVSPVMTMTPEGNIYNVAFDDESQEYVLSAQPVGGKPEGIRGVEGRIEARLEVGGSWNKVRFLALSQDTLHWLVSSSDVGRILCEKGLLRDSSICPSTVSEPLLRAEKSTSGAKVVSVVLVIVLVIFAIALVGYFWHARKGLFANKAPVPAQVKPVSPTPAPAPAPAPAPVLSPVLVESPAPAEPPAEPPAVAPPPTAELAARLESFSRSEFIEF
jgi:hypothetical protein